MAEPKKPDIWMPLYVADYQADTSYLTTEQHGAYLLMLMAYWRNGPIPDNDCVMCGITRMRDDAWRIARAVLEPYFQVRDGFWFHKRVEAEYDKAKRNRNSAHEKAVKASNARWAAARNNAPSMPQALPEHMLMQCPSPSPSPSPSQPEDKDSPSDLSPKAAKRHAKPHPPYQAMADLYGEVCGDLFGQRVAKLTDARKRAIAKAWTFDMDNPDPDLRTDSLDYWRRYFTACTRRGFFARAAAGDAKGEHAGWRPGFDFLIRQDTWLGMREGKYQ